MANASRSQSWIPTRRDVLTVGIAGFVAAVPFARRRPLTLVRRKVMVMGTVAEFAVAHRDRAVSDTAIDDAVKMLEAVDWTMSRFKCTSDIGRVNNAGVGHAVAVCADTATVLDAAIRWAEVSGGAFDPCLCRVVGLWDVAHRHEPPPAAAVARLANRHLYRALEVEAHAASATIRLHDADAAIDLGAIAKGYAVDRAVATLRDHGIAHALVGAGGDLYAMGQSPAGEPWQVGVQSPDDPRGIAGTLAIEDAAVATSGVYEQFFEYRGARYHHLLDPVTAAPRKCGQRSVTVWASSCMDADAGATAVFGASRDAAERVLAARGARLAHSV